MFRSWRDRGVLSLEHSLIVALLVLAAAGTIATLGQSIACLFADETVESVVAGVGPEGAAGMEYSGRCVDIRYLDAEDNGDGTVTLVWVGGEAPFTVYRSDTELYAFDAPNSPFLGVAHGAGTEVLPDRDGNDFDRVATVEAGYGQTWYEVMESGGDAVVAVMAGAPTDVITVDPSIAVVSAGYTHTVGLRKDGMVVAVNGGNDYGQCNVSSWTGIKAISASYDFTVGLRNDGTVVAAGGGFWGGLSPDVSSWTGIEAISPGYSHMVGLRNDGTVVAVAYNLNFGQCNVSSWTGIEAISAGYNCTVGLRDNGTVVAVGVNDYGQRSVSSWTGIEAISAGQTHTVGLRDNGTVVAVGGNTYGQRNVSSWTSITAISAGNYHTVGLRSDGTVVAVGRNTLGQCNVSSWTDIVAVSAGGNHTVGLRRDGTVVAVGVEDARVLGVASWGR